MVGEYRVQVCAKNISYRFVQSPNCEAHISIDGRHVLTTKPIETRCPQWSEHLDIPLETTSQITIRVFHVKAPLDLRLIGAKVVTGKELITDGKEPIRREYSLRQASGVTGTLVVTSSCKLKEQVQGDSVPISPIRTLSSATSLSSRTLVCSEPTGPDDAKLYVRNEYGDTTPTEVLGTIIEYVDRLMQFGDAIPQVYPYARLARLVLIAEASDGQKIQDDKTSLFLAIRDMLDFVNEVDALSNISPLQSTVSSMMKQIYECCLFIQEYARIGFVMRTIGDNVLSSDACVNQFISSFDEMKSNFEQETEVQNMGAVLHVIPIPDFDQNMDTEKFLERLPGWNLDNVRFNESRACLNGTRQKLLDNIYAWVHGPSDYRILWLSGGAGTGKSSIANSIALYFDGLGRLGACFRFNRDTAGLNSPETLFGNLCYQLAHFDHRLKKEILSAIKRMGHIAGSSIQTQAKKLIVEATKVAELIGPVVLVIDALDECGTAKTRREVLDAMASELENLPPSIKVIVTSRDEYDIRDSISDYSEEMSVEDAEGTVEDIEQYIKYRLRGTPRLRAKERSQALQPLCDRAGQLFIWAAVACNFIDEGPDPAVQLQWLLNATVGVAQSPWTQLDNLYSRILTNAISARHGNLEAFIYVVGSILALEAPLTREELDSLLGLGVKSSYAVTLPNGSTIHLSSSAVIIDSLQSILRTDTTVGAEKAGFVRLLHPSLYDFLTSRAEADFRIKIDEQNGNLAIRCLKVLNSELHFDICSIGNPSLLNKEIEDLPARIDQFISGGLRYSCHSFVYHVAKVSDPQETLIDELKMFVSEHLLHWMEVMSILGNVRKAEQSLQVLSGWMNDYPQVGGTTHTLIQEGIRLLRNCHRGIGLSALHIYYSALPLTPKRTDLFRCYSNKVPPIPSLTSSHATWPAATVRVLEGHTGWVMRVVFSLDGKMLASASGDKTLRLWDVESGEAIGDALVGHTDVVTHVAFSPDGKMLASASDDKTSRLWDIEKGLPIGDALIGHTSLVNHVAFSPDGKTLASASSDKTLRLWDVQSGRTIGNALVGHTEPVNHVVFSPSGKELASAGDNTLRLWEVKSGGLIGGALVGHTGLVNHVVFSPDGKTLASASNDKTLRLWDVKSGRPIGDALIGHTESVNHVVFSLDGKMLASASGDKTLLLWDVKSRRVTGSLVGHTGWVKHVDFSPDGKTLASASGDGTLRLWDIKSGGTIGDALVGHTDWVNHVVFSPNGKMLASASGDKTVRLWDIESGATVGDALVGHTDMVNHLVFSPNGRMLVSASDDNTLRLWDVGNGGTIGDALAGHTDWVNHVAFSPDGKMLASASGDNTLRLWDVNSRGAIRDALVGHTDLVNHVVFSPDGKMLASASDDKTIRLWDVEKGGTNGDALIGHTDAVNLVVFSPDGKMLASASGDNMLRLWDVESRGAIGHALIDHTEWVKHIAFSPDGKVLASVSDDNTFQLWDVESRHPVIQNSSSLISNQTFDVSLNQLLFIDSMGFLCSRDVRLFWLPVTLRGRVCGCSSLVAIGGDSGSITFLRFGDSDSGVEFALSL